MKKQYLVLLFLCIQMIAQAQTTYRYWFDADDTSEQEGTSSGKSLKLDIDVSDLTEALHQLHVQVTDKDGIQSAPITKWFVRTPTRTSHGVYWFDDNVSDLHCSDVLKGRFDIDVSDLTDGVHILNYQLRDKKDRPSSLLRTFFLKMPVPAKTKVHYWIDNDTENMQTLVYNGNTHILDLAKVEDGLHVLNIQADDTSPSAVFSKFFIKIPQTKGADKMTCICTIDGETVKQGEVTNHDGVLNWIVDVNNLSHGVHQIQVQVVTGTGAATSVYKSYFMRELTSSETASLKCLYTVDDNAHKLMAGNLGNGVFHFDLDVAEYSDGLHKLTYMLIGENGVISKTNNAFFWKTPLGGNGVVQYSYWQNDQTEKHVVKLPKRTNPFEFISLVPVDNLPVRSSCFDFKVENGQPMMYAKNDIHFEFVDAAGFVSLVNAQYVDQRAKENVTNFTDLQSTQTFARLNDNDIKWFKFEAEKGDTIAFKASQTTSMQVFAPSGKEIYAASGDKSIVYGGTHTWENGTYYVAVHDVTGSKPNVTLDYMHMDKYDVVSQDVRVVGNGGCSTITFQGNGFRDLYAVDLYTAQGDTIHSVDVGHESDASTTVTFDFTGAALGKYNALFRFTQEDKRFVDNITVEETRDIELATTVTYPSTFLRGTSTIYTIKITNKGNMTAYDVPVYTYISSKTLEGITSIFVEGVHKQDLLKNVKDTMPTDKHYLLEPIYSQFSDKLLFWHQKTVNEKGDSVIVRSNYLLTDIAPNSTQTVVVKVLSSEQIECWFTVSDTWSPIHTSEQSNSKSTRTSAYCCMAEKLECGINLLSNLSDLLGPLVPGGIGCAIAMANTAIPLLNSGICGGRSVGQIGKNYMAAAPSLIFNCAGFDKITSWAGGFTSTFLLAAKTLSDCGNAFKNKKPNCPPVPPKGGSSTPVNSLDPNDIYGYTHESGSKFINDSIKNVYYRIEFENDTTFATASAHVVEVKDTLDSKYFDLTTFAPTSVKIGNRVEYLDGTPNFVKTIDMRPEIYAIAQVEGKYDEKKGIAIWTFTSLDPMTMEPTDDVMQGFLPVNYDGSGIGEVAFDISLKGSFADGTEIPNKASIVFDNNDPIMTPIWTNIIDAVAPVSKATDMALKNDTTAIVRFEGSDERSGVWKYEVYAQQGINAPWIKITEVPADSSFIEFRIYDDIDYGYCTLAVDSAGNVENKTLRREVGAITYILGDADGDGFVTMADAKLVVDGFLGRKTKYINVKAADVNGDGKVTMADANAIVNICLGRK